MQNKNKPIEIGDRVIVVKPRSGRMHRLLKIGTAIYVDNYSICVEFDDSFLQGHSGGGLGTDKCCYWHDLDELELLTEDIKTNVGFSYEDLIGGKYE